MGLGKDAVLRPLSNEEEILASVPKLVKGNKRKRASVPEDPKPKKRTALLRLRDEDEDEDEDEENNGSALEARTKRTSDAPSTAGSMMLYEALPRTEDIPVKDSGGVPELSKIGDVSHRSQQMGDMTEGALESLRTEENAPDKPHDGEDPFYDLFTGIEDVAGTGDESDLFHGVRQALNQEAAVHREACSWSQNELRRYEADLQRVTDERNSLRLLLGQREEEVKDLRAELAKAYRDQTDLSEQVMILLKAYGLDTGTMANFSVSQLQQKIEMIGKLRGEVDVIKAKCLQWKEGMDRFAAEKETARVQLSSAETQLQRMKEKCMVQARRIEELEARLASVLAKAETDAEKAKTDADALVAVYRADAEAAQVQAREAAETSDTRAHRVAELAKCRSRRETLEKIHASGFDLAEEIKRAKEHQL
ncbi:uncharacterized protein [Nicotiana tomentosiformis]|uniref:uncharacterized protein n=1 Tax=Nicotiana tomentosiformis TaxID=4098 RepID=UPI00388C7776